MSGQSTPQRGLKSSPNSASAKQGPMKATIPMSSLLKSAGHASLKVSQSPTLSPTACWSKTRTSPDQSLGQRSPGSAVHKAKSKTLGSVSNSGGNLMRRTASLDTIYLKGQWPRESYYWQIGNLQVNKATQTDDRDWLDSRKIHSITENEDKLEKMLMQKKLQRSNTQPPHSPKSSTPDYSAFITNSSQTTHATCLVSPLGKAMPVNIPMKPLPRPTMRSSVEGLNQEIEGLVLKSAAAAAAANSADRREDYDKICQVTPEGHRAPFPDMFRHTRSVNTQTPSARDITGSCHSSSPASRLSLSPMIPDHMACTASDTDGSQGSSPDCQEVVGLGGLSTASGGGGGGNIKLGSSPQMFVARGPPDGCEKVQLKSSLELVGGSVASEPAPPWDPGHIMMGAQLNTFQLRQSSGSAFQLLQRPSPDCSGSELN